MPFPIASLLPKEETQALAFIHKHKTRGAGIRVAVLDTGVDPAAAGLTSRVVDLIDATGAGDVKLRPTEIISKSKEKLIVKGSTGRHIALNAGWVKNPSDQFKCGHKLAYDLWPEDLVKRRKEERKTAFTIAQAGLLSTAQKELTALEQDIASTKSTSKEKQREVPEDEEDPEKLKRQNLQDKISVLKEMMGSFEDVGPILDVITWHDGTHWRSVLGGAEGDLPIDRVPDSIKQEKAETILDLTLVEPMTDFKVERHYERFGKQDLLSYSVNFYEDGELLSIVTVSGSHGTHVAGIIAANHPEQPDLNGVSPQVEIVSIRIGDPRVKGMETTQALVRATKAIIDSGCQLANMSFGEDGAWAAQHKGAFIEQLVEQVIRKHNVIFCTSAGNEGPALSTVGAITAGSSEVFAVGAWVSKDMQDAEYALLERVPSSIYTWSSRGPSYDGARGVLCYAPGAAITSVPLYNLKHSQLMNGTSMASPSLCGNVALLLSALKAKGKSWSAASVRKSIDMTCKDVHDPLGTGLVQISDAYDYFCELDGAPDVDATWSVSVLPVGRARNMQGVYLRNPTECNLIQQFAVEVVPQFNKEDTAKIYDLDLQLNLRCSEKWVSMPNYVAVNGLGRLFNIVVDPTQLEPGFHATSLEAWIDNTRCVFKIPITVTKPISAMPFLKLSKTFTPGQLERTFFAVPPGATWAEITVKAKNRATPAQFWLHAHQLSSLSRLSQSSHQAVFALVNNEPQTKKWMVKANTTMELCATQAWNTAGKTDIEMSIDFHGLGLVTGKELYLDGGREIDNVEISSDVRLEAVKLSINLESRRTSLRPKESKIKALSARNDLANGLAQYQLLLTYEFKQSKKTGITLRFPIDDHLYDSAFSVLYVIQDKTKKSSIWGDVYPKEHQLEKGDFTVELQLVHSSFEVLEKLKGLALNVETKLAKGVTLDCFKGRLVSKNSISNTLKLGGCTDHLDALTSAKPYKFENVKMQPGTSQSVVVKTRIVDEDLWKDVKAGDSLIGQYHLTDQSFGLGRPVSLRLPPAIPKEKEDEPEDKETQLLIDLELEMAKKIEDEEQKKEYLAALLKKEPKHLPLLVLRLESLKDDALEAEVVSACDAIFEEIDEEALATYHGTQKSTKTAKSRKEAKKMKDQKEALLKAFDRALKASEKRQTPSEDGSFDHINVSSAQSTPSRISRYTDVQSLIAGYENWAEANDSKLALHLAKRDLSEGRPATALKRVRKVITDQGEYSEESKDARQLKKQILQALNWTVYLDVEARRELPRDILF